MRARAPPPVAIHTLDDPCTARQVPLAANDASPGSTGGAPSVGMRDQVAPPSSVRRRKSLPCTGSLSAMPCRSSQKAMASRKTPESPVVKRSVQCAPSPVPKILAAPDSAGPALAVNAWAASRGAIDRRSSVPAPGTVSTAHVAPASVVRSTRPPVPLAHTTRGDSATRPRISPVIALVCGTHCAPAGTAPRTETAVADNNRFVFIFSQLETGHGPSPPPERRRDDPVQPDQRHAFDPDRLAVVD